MGLGWLLSLLILRVDGTLASMIEERANVALADESSWVKVVSIQGPASLPKTIDPNQLEIEFAPEENFIGKSQVRLHWGNQVKWLTVYFERFKQAIVSARRLERGRVLREGDLEEKTIPVSKADFRKEPKLKELLGGTLLTTVEAGVPIRPEWVARPTVIRRGERVVVQVRSGNLLVQIAGQALADGRVGDVVPLTNVDSGKRIMGRVIEVGLVEVESVSGRQP